MQSRRMSYVSLDQRKVLCKKNQGPDSRDEKVIRLLRHFGDKHQIVWLIEVLNAVESDLLGLIGSFRSLHAKNQGPKSRNKKNIYPC